ncbi:hypothetical protein SeMB42_g00027 [Synchytrium endobioticum]|uniref:SDE2-like domain-containing protein n=1 Tax=Synchytrium endobioticum TaxID=286115 RepID=A0A507DVL9_9FUNG|nr:hypothetical protein SeLEV6574_g02049 [Synchytrium endobioticum]TPX54998.1 hypothetical protein SeMB42_g00027 [Synchytrium endobioticum]
MEAELTQSIVSIPYRPSLCITHHANAHPRDLYDEVETRLPFLRGLDYYICAIAGHALSRYAPQAPTARAHPHQLAVIYRCRGGKGGFGSQLRAQGGRMASQKSTNFEACRDLSGRRLKTVNDAKSLAEFIAREPERERDRQQRINQKIEEGLKAAQRMADAQNAHRPALSREYIEELEKVGVDVKNAVAIAMAKAGAAAKAQQRAPKANGSADGASSCVDKPAPKKIWGLDDDDSDESDDEEGPQAASDEEVVEFKGKGKAPAVFKSSKRKTSNDDTNDGSTDDEEEQPTIKKSRK